MKRPCIRLLRSSPLFGLAQRVRFALRPIPRRSSSHDPDGVTTVVVQPGISIEIYWIGPGLGPGPSASLYVYKDEVMRFDCFGGSRGHFHLNLTQSRYVSHGESARLYFPDGTIEDQVELARFELTRNFDYARRQNKSWMVRSLDIPQGRLESAACEMRSEMLKMVGEHAGS